MKVENRTQCLHCMACAKENTNSMQLLFSMFQRAYKERE